MNRYVLSRIGQAILVVFVTYSITFVILNWLPGDAVQIHLGAAEPISSLTPAEIAQLKREYGLNHSLGHQYLTELWNALHLNFGISPSLSEPVKSAISQRIGTTAKLALLALTLVLLLTSLLTYLTMVARWQWLRALLIRIPAVAVSIPGYVVGLALLDFFSFKIHIFPSTGTFGITSYILPALTMSIGPAALLAQVLISSSEKTLREPFIYTARAKGLTRGQIQRRHVLRNAALPAVTLLPLVLAQSIMNAVIAETVFGMSGIGRLAQEAVAGQDVELVQALVLLAATVFVIVNLTVDLLYPLLDPRISHTPNVIGR
jgi:peptide/nickel transport system permease protein